VQRALAFLGLVLGVVVTGWLDQPREIRSLRANLSGAESALLGGPGAIKYAGGSETILGPGGIDFATANCPPGYRVVYGNYDSVSAGSEVFFSGSFGSKRTWYVGLDNFDNRHSQRMGAVKVSAACAPSENPRSKRAERAARQRVKAAVRRHMTAVGYDEEYGDFGAASIPKPD
jgi:hypothetical protein